EGPAPITQVVLNESGNGKIRSTANPLGGDIHPYTAELAHFLDCLETGIAPLVTARDAMMDVKVALAAIESMRVGKPITIAEFIEPKEHEVAP
ncbi:MAG: hypothetical protein KDE31_32850, partial [Caldilineaceae bacterium]|nr:hypothetical protein [Caldilineaceae bacterium]